MTADVEAIAREALAAFDTRRQIEPFTARHQGFGVDRAYAAAAAVRTLRRARGEEPVGRKIGFTNRALWTQYGIDRPIFGDMYAQSVRPLAPSEPVRLAAFCEPLIEPEIALRLARAPEPGMDERALLDCVEWVAHGFEIVQSIFPGWRFGVADTVAAFGMHGAFRFGAPLSLDAGNRDSVFAALPALAVALFRDDTAIETGRGTDVLGGPLSALRHLVDMLAADPHNPQLAAGEIVTTGTLTRAYPIKPGETWSTDISGIPLAGLSVHFG